MFTGIINSTSHWSCFSITSLLCHRMEFYCFLWHLLADLHVSSSLCFLFLCSIVTFKDEEIKLFIHVKKSILKGDWMLLRKLRWLSDSLSNHLVTGHFRVNLYLCFKGSPSAKPFLWKWHWFAWKRLICIKMKLYCRTHFYMKGFALRLVWNRGTRELGSGLLTSGHSPCWTLSPLT